MRKRSLFPLIFFIILLIPSAICQQKRAKVLVMASPGLIDLAFSFLVPDPLTDPTPVSLRGGNLLQGDDIMRSIRQYFPRKYDELIEYEFIMMWVIEVLYLTPQQVQMLYNSIHDEGLGGMNDRSVMSMADSIAHPWADSILSDAFPNDADAVVAQKNWCFMKPVRYMINTNTNIPPIYRPYKELEGTEFAYDSGSSTSCITIPKEGAVVTTYQVGAYDLGEAGAFPDPGFRTPGWVPHSMYWQFGKGITWTHSERISEYWSSKLNPYGPDMILAEIIFSTGRKLPEDVNLVHHLRNKFFAFRSSSTITMSFLEFIDRFGADTTSIASEMVEVFLKVGDAKDRYREQEYQASLSMMEDAIDEMESLRAEAIKLKDQALVWIYTIEWLTVSGVFLSAGFVLWSLMIKRRLYREVTVTHLR
jgi:hypothetical protein